MDCGRRFRKSLRDLRGYITNCTVESFSVVKELQIPVKLLLSFFFRPEFGFTVDEFTFQNFVEILRYSRCNKRLCLDISKPDSTSISEKESQSLPNKLFIVGPADVMHWLKLSLDLKTLLLGSIAAGPALTLVNWLPH